MSKIPFRVTDGLDGADVRAINIGYPRRDNPTDGVNVQFFVDENTLQHYDSNRKYRTGFAVIHNNRAYFAKRDVPTDGSDKAGPFNVSHWQQLRTDPNWLNVISTPVEGYPIIVGSYISADPTYSDLEFVMPLAPQAGDTVVLKDASGLVGTKALKIKTTDKVFETGKQDYQITFPKSTVVFTYDPSIDLGRGGWRITTINPKVSGRFVGPTADGTQVSNGDTLFRRSANGKIKLILPRYANEGDFLVMYDMDQMTSVNNLTIDIHPNSDASIGVADQKSMTFKTVGWGMLAYNETQKIWYPWDGDEFEKWLTIRPNALSPSNLNLIPSNRVLVAGNEGTVNFTLPTGPAIGDIVVISLRNAAKGVKVNIKTSNDSERIFAEPAMFGIPRLNEVGKFDNIAPVAEVNHVSTGYGEQFKLAFVETQGQKGWILAEQSFASFRASKDPSVRDQPGLVAFATESEVMLNTEQTPTDEKAVTPLTLSKKVALEDRRGIAYIASQSDTNAGTDDSKIVTPKKLHERTALEDRRGIAEIATQDETNAGTDDSRIVTPKKLAGRIAKEDQTGVIGLVKVSAEAQPARDQPGKNINDFNDHSRAVTPKTLSEKVATETNLGMAFWATQAEVNNGTVGNFFVRPSTLHARTATPTRTGLARMVDMATGEHLKDIATSPDSNVFITPKALASRIATPTMDGISRQAIDADITAGTDNVKFITPAKLKYFTDVVSQISATDADGLNIVGTIWKGLTCTIDLSTETKRGTIRVASQDETNAGTIDDAVITPKKLNDRTSTQKRTGIVRLATSSEAAAGVRDDVAITPLTMGSALNNASEWGSTEVRRGAAYIAGLTNDNAMNSVWQGTDELGSTRALVNYQHDFYAVSPRGLNTALSHYLPIKGKAFDSDKLDGLDSLQFMRTDKDTGTTGSITATKQVSAAFLKADKSATVNSVGSYIGFNKDTQNAQTDFINVRAADEKAGFAFWTGTSDADLKRVAAIDGTGKINATSITTTGVGIIGSSLTVAGEINYRNQTLDDRFANVTGDTFTGNVNFTTDKFINFEDHNKIDGTLNYMIKGAAAGGTGYVAMGAIASNKGFLEIGTGDTGVEPIHVRQRQSGSIRNSFTLLDENGNTNAPKTVSADQLVIRNTGESIRWGNKSAKVNNVGDIFGEVWENKYLSEYLKEIVDAKVSKSGDTMTGDLIIKQDIIIEGEFKIKVGNKYLVIRPNEANETVSFDWENI